MLTRVNDLLKNGQSFAFETTLATKIYKSKIEEAKRNGYIVTLLFFWLQNIELAKERVSVRVAEGGHNITPDVIERRYMSGIKNLFNIYLPIVDGVLIFDNSNGHHELMAQKNTDGMFEILNETKFKELKNYENHR
ncbi:MAG TPA: zeta toxin family protein [Pelobium sp.]|nr:zeta toxin family protein [Pelobium sp.]